MAMSEDLFQLGVKLLLVDVTRERVLLLQVNVEDFADRTESYWDIPGGRVQRGDTIMDTLRRELQEETGVGEVPDPQLLTTVLAKTRIPHEQSDTGLLLQIYTSTVTEAPDIQLSAEHTDYQWMTPRVAAEALQTKYPAEFTEYVKNVMSV